MSWLQRLERATQIIEEDDAARDKLGLPKPSFEELADMNGLKRPQAICDAVLHNLGLADIPPGGFGEDR